MSHTEFIFPPKCALSPCLSVCHSVLQGQSVHRVPCKKEAGHCSSRPSHSERQEEKPGSQGGEHPPFTPKWVWAGPLTSRGRVLGVSQGVGGLSSWPRNLWKKLCLSPPYHVIMRQEASSRPARPSHWVTHSPFEPWARHHIWNCL